MAGNVARMNNAFDPEADFISSVASNRRRGGGPIASAAPGGVPLTGIKALMLAVLEDGIRCYLGNKKKLQREAELWMYCSRRLVFSFNVLCETFGLDPNATRQALRRMRKQAAGSNLRHRGRQNVRHNVISLA